MNEPVKGIIHVHSDFSSDGLHSVADLADFAREVGFRFVGLTDHAEDLSDEDMRSLQRECEKHSDGSCVLIPGLEFRCSEDIHILGLGIVNGISSMDPVTVARQIQSLGGLAILAHPGRNGYQCPRELYTMLNGIEIWNAAYDGQFVPPVASLRLLQEARTSNPSILGFGGADLHGLHGSPGVTLELRPNSSASVSTRMVLPFLRTGKFLVRGRYVSFDAHDAPSWLTRVSLWTFRKSYEVCKAIRDVALGQA